MAGTHNSLSGPSYLEVKMGIRIPSLPSCQEGEVVTAHRTHRALPGLDSQPSSKVSHEKRFCSDPLFTQKAE